MPERPAHHGTVHRRLWDARSGALADAGPTLVPEGLEVRTIPRAQLEMRAGAGDGDGTFEGWALRWNTTDSYGTRFHRAAFDATLDAEPYAFLWMHDPWVVLGSFTAAAQDEGLWIAGAYDPTPEGQAGRARAVSRSAAELSIGFRRLASNPDDENEITEALLMETSQITARMAAVPGASLTDARSHAIAGQALEARRRTAAARLRLVGAGLGGPR